MPTCSSKPHKRKPMIYHQSTLETCGASCVLMLLRIYRKVDRMLPTKEKEIDRDYHSRVLKKGMTAAAMADCLSARQLKVELLHSDPEYMHNRNGYFDPGIYPALMAEYREHLNKCAHRIICRTGVQIDCDFLRAQLDLGKEILLECAVDGMDGGREATVLHWVLLYRYEGDQFWFCDPKSHCRSYSSRDLEETIHTPVGRICLLIGP